MKMSLEYNIKKYINSISEIKNMHLNAIIGTYSICKRYELDNEVSEYIHYIDKKPFYVPPSFNDVKTNIKTSSLKPKFILFSAPGATGKSTLAYHIANQFNALYWNLSKVKVGTNSFAGSILAAVGPSRYSEFVGDLNTGNVLLVIDALDEAEIISGRKMINNFIMDISNTLTSHEQATVFLLARTETAQYIASFCTDNDISIDDRDSCEAIGVVCDNEIRLNDFYDNMHFDHINSIKKKCYNCVAYIHCGGGCPLKNKEIRSLTDEEAYYNT